MAFIEKRKSGWRAQIRRKGAESISRTFDLRKDAQAWAAEIEREIRRGNLAVVDAAASKLTFNEVANHYAAGPLTTLRSRKTSELFLREARARFGPRFVNSIKGVEVAKWRDTLVRRGMSLRSTTYCLSVLSTVFSYAQRELSVHLPAGNPVSAVRKPSPSKGRDRRLLPGELEALLQAADSSRAPGLRQAIELAVETSMRLSEIIFLEWRHIDLSARTAHLPDTKNGDSRTVALSSTAVASLSALASPSQRRGAVFGNWGTKYAFEKAWAHCRKSALAAYLEQCSDTGNTPDPAFLDDLRFHDLRHEATSRLFERGLGVMEVASMTGHKSLSMLKRYTHVEASRLAEKLG